MSPTHTQNHGRRYTYYASNINDDPDAPALRLPAGEIEQAVRRAIATWFRTDTNIRNLTSSRSAHEKRTVFEKAALLASEVAQLPVSIARDILASIELHVSVSEQRICGTFCPARELGLNTETDEAPSQASFEIALDRQSYDHEPRLRLQPSEPERIVRDDGLVELLGRAFAARDELLGMDEVASRSIKTTRLRHLQRLPRLSYLDPAIVRSILAGTQPKSLSSRSLWRMADLPVRYADQRKVLGFSQS